MAERKQLDRRTFVRLAGTAGVAATAGCESGQRGAPGTDREPVATGTTSPTESSEGTESPEETEEPVAYGFFDAEQAATVATIVDRLLPPGENRPAATELGVVRYIDRALRREPFYETAHDDRRFQEAYKSGLERLDETARSLYGTPVRELDDEQVDELLTRVLDRSAPGWEDVPTASAVTMTIPADAFVTLLRDHAIEGYYSQPKYGGNIDLAGWKQAGYVGPFLEGYRPDELKPPWKPFEEHEQTKTRPPDLYGEFGGEDNG